MSLSGGARAEAAAARLAKGHKVAVRGRLSLDDWTTTDGHRRRSHRILADDIEFLTRTDRATPADDGEPAGTAP